MILNFAAFIIIK